MPRDDYIGYLSGGHKYAIDDEFIYINGERLTKHDFEQLNKHVKKYHKKQHP